MSTLLNLSEGSSLALHSLAIIAGKTPERVNVKYLAKKLQASEAHLAKVFQQLSKSGVVRSFRGPNGGFVLSKSPNDISLLEIHELIDGKVDLQTCPLGKNHCPMENCIFGNSLTQASLEAYKVLNNTNLLKFSKEFKNGN